MANNEESFYYENNSFIYESYAEQLEPQNSLNNDVSLAAFGTNDVEQPEKNKEFGANQEESDEGDVQILTVLEGAGYIPQKEMKPLILTQVLLAMALIHQRILSSKEKSLLKKNILKKSLLKKSTKKIISLKIILVKSKQIQERIM